MNDIVSGCDKVAPKTVSIRPRYARRTSARTGQRRPGAWGRAHRRLCGGHRPPSHGAIHVCAVQTKGPLRARCRTRSARSSAGRWRGSSSESLKSYTSGMKTMLRVAAMLANLSGATSAQLSLCAKKARPRALLSTDWREIRWSSSESVVQSPS